ncbi:hypothetical protein D3C81_2215910 [compost metagenome]
MVHSLQGQTRFLGQLLTRVAYTQADYREYILRQLQQLNNLRGITADAPDRNNAKPH